MVTKIVSGIFGGVVVRKGETLEQNLFREIKEEIGSERSDFEIIGTSTHKIEYDYPPDTVLKVHGGKYRGPILRSGCFKVYWK